MDGVKWRVIIGLNDTIKSVYQTNNRKSGVGDIILTFGNIFNFVEDVNRKLMEKVTK